MHKLLPLLTVLLLFTACDPCDCDDCCVDSLIIEFQNATDDDLILVWHDTWTIDLSDQGGQPINLAVSDTLHVLPATTIVLNGFIAPATIGELNAPPFDRDQATTCFDSLHVLIGDELINRFTPADCTVNPLCESAYNRSERELSNSTETTFLYVYE